MNSDKLTTVTGAALAVVTAANTVVGQMAPGTSMHTQDYVSLVMAVLFAVMGFFTNKQKAE